MRTSIVTIGVVFFANVSLACAQNPPNDNLDPVEIEAREVQGRFAILPGRRTGERIAESAEAAEDLAAERRPERFWLRSEFLLWWIKTANLPPLVTTGAIGDPRPGALDSANTRVNFGRSSADFQDRGGGRFSAGWWLDDEQHVGFEGSYFFLAGRSLGQTFSSVGSPILARPFFNANAGFQDSQLVAFPGINSGSIEVNVPSFLQGAEMNMATTLMKTEAGRWEAIGGLRYLDLQDGLHINETSVVALAPQYVGLGIPYNGATIRVSDRFDTRNQFYGGQLGGRAEFRRKRFTLDVMLKAALGVSHEEVTIRGSTTIDAPTTAQNAGLYAVSSNSGRFTRDVFAVVPEVGVNLKFELTKRIRIFGGYSFLYWSSVARPWDHVDPTVNTNLVPTSSTFGAGGGPARPAFAFHGTSFFAHGANFGVEFHY